MKHPSPRRAASGAVLASVLFAPWALPAHAQVPPAASAPAAAVQAQKFTLANGMTLIVKPDRRAPTAVQMLWVRVGSFDEFRLSKTLGDYLTSINDPRLAVFGRATEKSVVDGDPEVEGIPNGLEDTQALSYNGGPQNV